MTAAAIHKVGDRQVKIFDDILSLKARHEIYDFAIKASYQIGWGDTNVIEQRQYQNLHANCTSEDLNRLGLLMHLAPTPVFEEIKGLELAKAVINLSTPSDVYFAHTHPEWRVLLYYANLEWRPHWFGETLFFDDSLRRIDLALPYSPGRIVVFDGDCPHSIRPQSAQAPVFRFTLALLFNKSGGRVHP